ncbi:hypothetical protein [Campylobacter iguaniorum]|nr:hypothetical protein [Campylobacter iguaniorum]
MQSYDVLTGEVKTISNFKDEVLDSKSEFICEHRKVKNVGISYDYAK